MTETQTNLFNIAKVKLFSAWKTKTKVSHYIRREENAKITVIVTKYKNCTKEKTNQ